MEDEAYRAYEDESADWLRAARARLVSDLVARHRPHGGRLEMTRRGYRPAFGLSVYCVAPRKPV